MAPGAPGLLAARAVAGFFLSGFLFALLGAILPAWGYHRDPPNFLAIGNYFLCMGLGMIASTWAARRLLPRGGVPMLLVLASTLACMALLGLALASPPAASAWRMVGITVVGLAGGMLNNGLFHAMSGGYASDPARTVAKAGILYGLGCLAVTLLVAGTFYAYSVPAILVLMAVVPGAFAALYAHTPVAAARPSASPTLREALRDFRSPVAVLFALLLFFQFGNEWSLAGWLPLFLVRRLGISPTASLLLLALYWLVLLAGRMVAVWGLRRVRRGRLLLASGLGAVFGLFLLYFTNNAFGAGAALVVLGASFASIYPLVAEKIGRRFPYYHPGFFNGIFSFALMGGLLAPATLGYYAALEGIGVVMALPLLGTCMVFVLLLAIWLEAKVSGA